MLFRALQLAEGNAFQHLFARYMAATYGADFSETRPAGSKGDKGCDGYKYSSRTVYQCYGKDTDGGVKSGYLVAKINKDFATAKSDFPASLMEEWIFVHNIFGGLPTDAAIAIAKLKAANPSMKIGDWGPRELEDLLFTLPETTLDDLFDLPEDVGAALDPADVQRLLKGLSLSTSAPKAADLRPVPLDKIDFNKLSEAAARVIRDNTQYASQVAKFVNNDPDPLFGDSLARTLRDQYDNLRAQDLSPDDIMDRLIGFILGDRTNISLAEVKTAEAIMAYFFGVCDVFENVPKT